MLTLNRCAATLAGVALLAMAVIGTLDVIGGAFGRPLVGTYEITEALMVVAIFMALSSAQQRNAHIRVEILVQKLARPAQIMLGLFGLACSIVFFALIAYYGWTAALRSILTGEFRQGQISFPVWPSRLALALGATIMAVQCIVEFYGHVRNLRPKS